MRFWNSDPPRVFDLYDHNGKCVANGVYLEVRHAWFALNFNRGWTVKAVERDATEEEMFAMLKNAGVSL